MVFLIGIVVLGFCVAGVFAFGLIGAESKGRAKATENAGEILDKTFDGSETVTYDSRVYNHLSSTETVKGALERGYTLVHDDGGNLTFSKRQS